MIYLPKSSVIDPTQEPVLHWGVRFATEGTPPTVLNYGPGEDAKARAEGTVEQWTKVDSNVTLVCQTILPWTSSTTTHSRVLLTQRIREENTDPRAVLVLRHWLIENGYDDEGWHQTRLAEQVALIKQMRKAPNIEVALNLFNVWMRESNYESLTVNEAVELIRETVD